MALTEAERKQLEALQKKENTSDDEEFSIWVRNADGHETRLSGDRAIAWCKRNGYDVEEAEDSTAGDPLEAEGGDATTTAPKKAAPKKATPKAGETVDDQAGPEDLAPDAPATGARKPRQFF